MLAGGRESSGGTGRGFRPDIEGLRAVAVVGVVLYHARSTLLPGGFTGVDVFFVISGYLITGHLWREAVGSGRISLPGFYARRARRLLPAAMVVIVATAVAARALLPPLVVPRAMWDGLASALYVGNYRFAAEQTNYLNATAVPSPFQHFWSLGVEEQFYLLWPLLLLGTVLFSRFLRRMTSGAHARFRDRSRACAVTALAVATAASFASSVWLTGADQPWAFFSLPTRAWELGAGGVLALAAPHVGQMPGRAAALLGWAGLGVLVASMWLIGPTTPFPGWAAYAPAAGTIAVLAAGEPARRSGGPVLALGLSPVRFVGRISYSWYLWHWPFLVLAPYALGHPLSVTASLAVAALSGAVAVASFHLVEAPARGWPWLAGATRRGLLSGLSVSAVSGAACVGLVATVPSLSGHGTAHVAALPYQKASAAAALTTPESLTARVQAQIAASVGIEQVPVNLTPSLGAARTDESDVMVDGCMDPYPDQAVRTCTFADTTSPTSIALFGDSHAASWFPAVNDAAAQNGWKVYNYSKAVCPPLLLPVWSPDLGRDFYECGNWRQAVLDRLRSVRPTLVILAMARHYTSIYGFTPYSPAWNAALAQMVSTIESMGSRVLVVGPVPKPAGFVPECLSAHLDDAAACTVPAGTAIDQTGEAAERRAVEGAGGAYLDVRPWFCTRSACAVIAGNIDMWRDDNHITYTWADHLGPAMAASLQEILVGP